MVNALSLRIPHVRRRLARGVLCRAGSTRVLATRLLACRGGRGLRMLWVVRVHRPMLVRLRDWTRHVDCLWVLLLGLLVLLCRGDQRWLAMPRPRHEARVTLDDGPVHCRGL